MSDRYPKAKPGNAPTDGEPYISRHSLDDDINERIEFRIQYYRYLGPECSKDWMRETMRKAWTRRGIPPEEVKFSAEPR